MAEAELNPLEMSDEDIMNAPEPTDEVQASEQDDDEGAVEGTVDNAGEGQEAAAEDTDSQQQEVIDEEDPISNNETLNEEETNDEHERQEEENAGEETKDAGKEAKNVVNTDAQLAALFSPFKANGKDMSVTSIDDARTLMQMGANYNKKMAGLKPNLKLMKMLDKNELLDEEKLSYLIDLNNGNPEAITKLLKDRGLDPMEIDVEQDTKYTPGTYNVTDQEIDLDSVLETIQDTPTFKDTIDTISNKWDDKSRQTALETPELIATINDHMASGIYPEVMAIVDNERTLGRLTNLTDIEAYKHVGEVLQQQGAFNTPNGQQQQTTPVTQTTQTNSDTQSTDRRRAASGTKKTNGVGRSTNFNPLEMSDDDFDKVAAPI